MFCLNSFACNNLCVGMAGMIVLEELKLETRT